MKNTHEHNFLYMCIFCEHNIFYKYCIFHATVSDKNCPAHTKIDNDMLAFYDLHFMT